MLTRHFMTCLVIAALLGCGDYSTGSYTPPEPEPDVPITSQVTDPAGDAIGSEAVKWDITSLTVTRATSFITLVIDFTSEVIPPFAADSNAIVAFVDLDTDQNAATGIASIVDAFRTNDGTTGIGTDYTLLLAEFNRADSTFAVLDSLRTKVGSVRAAFARNRVTVEIPLALLGDDDGFVNAAMIVGTFGSPNDILPDDGHLTLADPGVPAPPPGRERRLPTGPQPASGGTAATRIGWR